MSDHEQLLLVIAVIYLSDCLFWASRCAVVFRDSFLSGRFAVSHPSTFLGHDRGGVVWRNPLPPFGMTLVCPDRPLAITPEFAYAYTSASALFGARPEHTDRLVALEDLKCVTVDSKDVLVNGQILVRTDSPLYARYLAGLLEKLSRVPASERAAAIEADFQASLDTARIDARLAAFERATSSLRLVCTVLFLVLFLALPWVILRDLFGLYWPLLLGTIVTCVAVIAVLYARGHRVLYPDDRSGRRSGLLMMLLVPPAAVRASDALARNLVVGFDILAVARVVCDEATFTRLASRLLRDLMYPALPACPGIEREKADTETSHRSAVLGHYVRFLEREGQSVDRLIAPPRPDTGSFSYCPRCHEQFLITNGECRACGGIPLATFPSGGSETDPGAALERRRTML